MNLIYRNNFENHIIVNIVHGRIWGVSQDICKVKSV